MKRTVDIARKGSRVISITDNALPAVRHGIRQTFARHTFVSKSFSLFRKRASKDLFGYAKYVTL